MFITLWRNICQKHLFQFNTKLSLNVIPLNSQSKLCYLSFARLNSSQPIEFSNPKVGKYLKKVQCDFEKAKLNKNESSTRIISKLSPLISYVEELENINNEMSELNMLLSESKDDKEMKQLALSDIKSAEQQCIEIQDSIIQKMIDIECNEASINDIELEVSAGVGGQEAMLFCEEIFNMYHNYSLYKGWDFVASAADVTPEGGMRKARAFITGDEVYSYLKYEGGVHRVQRIPTTEKSGRIHTSTICVAIMPQPKEADIELNNNDIKMETMRAGGAGGQHVNTTDSAVRITHLPTGIVVESQQERSQFANKKNALQKLRNMLYQIHIDKEVEKYQSQRKLQIGSRTRTEKIRTYNFQQDRLTDHRIGLTTHNLNSILQGKDYLENIINQVAEVAYKEQIVAVLDAID